MHFSDLLDSSSDYESVESELSNTWSRKKKEAFMKVSTALKISNKKFLNENDYIDFIYDDCRSYLAPLTKLIDRHVDTKSTKNVKVSETFREQGNNVYKEKNFEFSFYLYTKSIAHAPLGSTESALAYANRSAVSFEIYKFQDCIADIQKSLENQYPQQLQYKIFLRLAQCYKHLGEKQLCNDALSKLNESLNYAVYKHNSIKEHYETSLRELQLILLDEEMTNDFNTTESIEMGLASPIPVHGWNTNLSGASAAISIEENAELGRHVIANKKIKMGDILFVEEPYCFITSCNNTTTVCSYCNANEKILISSCENCFRMLYCSDTCRNNSWKYYHRWECNGILSTLEESITLAHLGFRLLLKGADVNYKKDGSSKNSDNDYKPIYDLVTNLDKMHVDDIMVYSVCAVTLTYYLKVKTNFFEWYSKKSNMDKSLISRFLSTLALRHLCQLQCNAHAERFEFQGERYHKSAIYPSSSLMNHSCNSNILNDYFNSLLIVRASRNIKKGDEVTNSYGFNYKTHTAVERQKSLKEQYYFDCKCEACTKDEFKFYYELHSAIKCPICRGKLTDIQNTKNYKCVSCKYELPPNSGLLKKYERACKRDHSLLKQDGILRSINLLKEVAHEDNHQFIKMYYEIYVSCQIQKQYDESISVAKKYLDLIIKKYGLSSHMTSSEMLEIASVMIQNMQYLDMINSPRFKSSAVETLQFLNETKQCLSIFYGPWNARLKLIEEYLSKANALWDSYLRFKD